MISALDDEAQSEIADVVLRWKAFFVRDCASVVCLQSSTRESFRCCSKTFRVVSWPTLILSHSPDMLEYVKFERQLILALSKKKGALHRFLTALQVVLERTGSLGDVRKHLMEDSFWADFKLVPSEAKQLISMSEQQPGSFDVFLSHNSHDKRGVLRLAKALRSRGIKVWLDEWELLPGRPWQDALKAAIKTVRTALVLVGADGLGPWETPEMRGCISQFVERQMPVIPVLLPGAAKAPDLPLFLRQLTWVDLRRGLTKDGIERLERGILRQPRP
jgi:nucleotide-binding universal stress UspA family protein